MAYGLDLRDLGVEVRRRDCSLCNDDMARDQLCILWSLHCTDTGDWSRWLEKEASRYDLVPYGRALMNYYRCTIDADLMSRQRRPRLKRRRMDDE